jgi:glycosyltransferase involved in cell wall biosynthesis
VNSCSRRVLLVTYRFPPDPAAGALRPGYLARYLPEFGWDVSVLTRQTSFDALRVPFRIADALFFPDATAPWILDALRRGYAHVDRLRFDAVLSTAMPPSAHIIGCLLAKRARARWVADYRDAWTGNPYLRRPPFRRALERRLERALLRQADAVTAVSSDVAERVAALRPNLRVNVIPNGYDPRERTFCEGAIPESFDLCYTGSMYDGRRTPEILFQAIRELRDAEHPAGLAARVHFFGPDSAPVAACAERYGIAHSVAVHGVVPRQDALRAQSSSAALLIFLSMDPRTSRETGSKILEYASARRPIIAFGPWGSALRELLGATGIGWFAFDAEGAKEALISAYARFQDGRFEVEPKAGVFPTARDLAARFSDVLDAQPYAVPNCIVH